MVYSGKSGHIVLTYGSAQYSIWEDSLIMQKRLFSAINLRQLLTIALIVVGLVMVVVYGLRTVRSYRQVRYIQAQGFDTGDADADAIRPWMTIHFVAAAYAVPEEYIYAELGIDLERRRRNIDVGRLNQELR